MVIIHQTWLLCLHTVAKLIFWFKNSILIGKVSAAVCLHFMVISAVCLHFTNFSAVCFIFHGEYQLFVYISWWILSVCLYFIVNFIRAAVCLYFMLNFSCLFVFHDEFYLVVYNFHSRSAICLHFMVNFICLFT